MSPSKGAAVILYQGRFLRIDEADGAGFQPLMFLLGTLTQADGLGWDEARLWRWAAGGPVGGNPPLPR